MTNYNRHVDLIKTLLLEHCPELDLKDGEKVILETCRQDLYLHCMYLIDTHLATDPLFLEYFSFFVLHFEMGIEHETQPILTPEQEIKYDIDCEKFAKQLVDEWWSKFQVRTQVKPTKSDEEKKAMSMFMGVRNIFTPEEIEEIHHYLAVILLRNGERCFLQLMVDNLIRGIVATKVNPKKMIFTSQDKVQIIQLMGLEAKRMTERSGPLVIMFPDQHYYKAKMSEWRGGDMNAVI